MTSPLVVPEPVSQAATHFLSVIDKANVLVELGRFKEAESHFAQAQQLAGDDRENELLVDMGRLCVRIEQGNHSQALASIAECLEKYDDLLSAPENGCLRQDLLAQRASSLVALRRWQPVDDALCDRDVLVPDPEVRGKRVAEEQVFDEMEAAYRL
jgi:hypothetical protein